jgi:hypothetical protein
VMRLNIRCLPFSRIILTMWTRSRLAPAATSRGMMVSSMSSSAVSQMTLPCRVCPSLQGSGSSAVTQAITLQLMRPFPLSGRPPISPSLPIAKRLGQSQRMARIL